MATKTLILDVLTVDGQPANGTKVHVKPTADVAITGTGVTGGRRSVRSYTIKNGVFPQIQVIPADDPSLKPWSVGYSLEIVAEPGPGGSFAPGGVSMAGGAWTITVLTADAGTIRLSEKGAVAPVSPQIPWQQFVDAFTTLQTGLSGAATAAVTAAMAANSLVKTTDAQVSNLGYTLVYDAAKGAYPARPAPVAIPAATGAAGVLAARAGTPVYSGGVLSGGSVYAASGIPQQAVGTNNLVDGDLVTVEFRGSRSSVPSTNVVGAAIGSNVWVGAQTNGTAIMTAGGTNKIGGGTTGTNICDGAMHHVAMVFRVNQPRTASNSLQLLTGWVDGVQLSGSPAAETQALDTTTNIGSLGNSQALWGGSIDWVRVSKGARYTAAFTPPSSPTWDTSTYVLADCASAAYQYQSITTLYANGAVTYRGSVAPTDALSLDTWLSDTPQGIAAATVTSRPLGYTLVYNTSTNAYPARPANVLSPVQASGAGTTSYGTPAYSAGLMSGGALAFAKGIPSSISDGDLFTIEFRGSRASVPANNVVGAAVGTNVWLGAQPGGSGAAIVRVGSASIGGAGVVVCDGNMHHICLVVKAITPGSSGSLQLMGGWVDGVAFSNSTTAQASNNLDSVTYAGGWTAATTAWGGSIDWVRVSKGARYTVGAAFTAPTTATYDATTLVLYDGASAAYQYAASQGTVPGGAVTYRGPIQPTDALPNDIWEQVTVA